MTKPLDEADARSSGSNAYPRARQHSTSRTNATVVVDTGHTTRTTRLLDLLADCADDPEAFERLGAIKVGEMLFIDSGRTSVTRVR